MSTEDIEKKEEWRERFRKEFVCGHPGDSGPGGNTPSEPESWIEAYPHEVEDFIYAERQNARAEAEELRQALVKADAHLSLLRHRCENRIPWGEAGIPEKYDVDQTIGMLRRLYE